MKFWFWKYLAGRQTLKIGTVKKGFLKGATVTEVADYTSNDPDACYSEFGLTELRTKLTTITFQTGKLKVFCFGTGMEKFEPGLKSTWINKLNYVLIYHILKEKLY